ncbi:hypothetical protein PQD71_gp229 [Kosakonia phage Kc263]|uniref:Uncharacterized protein n=1 Tax=Kosakonia phage Kc263 TaxID=2863194 RepID=A0AAE7WFZ5_9CAUD|nr:hypothetical protein PQD71_gp229 [Kosakonia phage Kc263]QYN80097.1 hypothetical protein [Kosakonia phage Kc263]
MSLASIVSGVVKKESKVDRRKVAYFFRDYKSYGDKQYPIELLLRILNPDEIFILSLYNEVIGDEDNNAKVDRIVNNVSVLLPNAKVTVVHGSMDPDNGEVTLAEDSVITKEQLSLAEVGLFIDKGSNLYVYKAAFVPQGPRFYTQALDKENLEALRDDDLDVLLPTEDMYMISDLIRNSEPEIKICYFMPNDKGTNVKKVTEIIGKLLTAKPRTAIQTHYFEDDWKGWETGSDHVNLFSSQSDYVLAIRGDRIDVHLELENGELPKDPSGWLLLN